MSVWTLRPSNKVRAAGGAAAGLATLLILAAWASPVAGTISSAPIYTVRIEEDWSLTVTTPNASLSCPQVSTQMSPGGNATQFYQFHINFQDIPSFKQGGLQLEAWDGNKNLAVNTSPNTATMNTPNELVTWTQYLARDENNGLTFGVNNAASQTWGNFSGAQFYVSGANSVLDDYAADYSVQNSGITYGNNLVSSLVLVQTRKYYSDGSVQTNSTPRIIYNSGS